MIITIKYELKTTETCFIAKTDKVRIIDYLQIISRPTCILRSPLIKYYY